MSALQLKHWRVDIDANGIAWVTIDVADSKAANTLGSEACWLNSRKVLDALEATPPQAMVIQSGKAAGFIAGADLEEYEKGSRRWWMASRASWRARNWALFARLEAVAWPTLALIRGHCMGGGLELSLACVYRIAVDEPATRMALPKPTAGDHARLGRICCVRRAIIGPTVAMDMMLTGVADRRQARQAHGARR